MPIKIENLSTAYVLNTEKEWVYICRFCMNNNKEVRMGIYHKPTQSQYQYELWAKCPICGASELVGTDRRVPFWRRWR